MENNIEIIEISNDKLKLTATNYGCHIIKLESMDRNGNFQNNVITLADTEEYKCQDKYIGALVGRVANRIADGKFTLNGVEHTLARNSSINHLHGGVKGLNQRMFSYKKEEHQIIFNYASPHGEEGYPGNLDIEVRYILNNNTLTIDYQAKTDRDTIVNLTNHSYFTLGEEETAENLILQLNSDKYVTNDENGMATGLHKNVENTAFDFRKPKAIGRDIADEDEQLILAGGYDHAFKLEGGGKQGTLYNPENGIEMTFSTTMPYAHIYTANYLEGERGENGRIYNPRSAVCIETEYMPNGINNGYPEGILLKKGEVWQSKTEFEFKIK